MAKKAMKLTAKSTAARGSVRAGASAREKASRVAKARSLYSICCQRNPSPEKQRLEIEAAVKSGADVHETDKNGVTPLHLAVRFRNPAAVESLLRHGAVVNQACTRSGSTPLHRAVTSTGAPGTAGKFAEARQIITILLRHGADPALRNRKGKRAVDYVRDDELRRLLGKNKR